MTAFAIRPSLLNAPLPDNPVFQPPSSNEILGDWFIVQTSLPYWRDKRNVKITYSNISPSNSTIQSVQDEVSYRTLTSETIKTLRGINTPSPRGQPGAWDWRGSGWVKVVSNHWEILSYGNDQDGGVEWMVIYTEKSFFTPAAVHVYSRKQSKLPEAARDGLVNVLVERQHLKALVEGMYEVQQS